VAIHKVTHVGAGLSKYRGEASSGNKFQLPEFMFHVSFSLCSYVSHRE